jgi:hypothetical protein
MNTWQKKWNAERFALAADALRHGVRLRLQVRGDSMLPSLWPGDTVEIADCQLENIHPGEVVLAFRADCLILHRFLAHRQDGFLLRGDSMVAPDAIFPPAAFWGRLVHVRCAGRTVRLPVPLRPWSRALGVLLRYCSIARRVALKIHSWQSSGTMPVSGALVKDTLGPQ